MFCALDRDWTIDDRFSTLKRSFINDCILDFEKIHITNAGDVLIRFSFFGADSLLFTSVSSLELMGGVSSTRGGTSGSTKKNKGLYSAPLSS